MNNFLNNIANILDDYLDEISQLQKIIVNFRISDNERRLIEKFTIPAFYSNWEGFFVKSLTEYINYINSLTLGMNEIRDELLAHNLDVIVDLKIERKKFDAIKKHARDIFLYFNNSLYIENKIITESNVNFKAANQMLDRLCLNQLPKELEHPLNKLLLFRNNISHGQFTVPINKNIINELANIVLDCMYNLYIIIEEGMRTNCFKKIV
jgi:hypothetical protein